MDLPLRQAVRDLPSSLQTIVGYHLGWLDDGGRAVKPCGGKAIRPTLAMLSAEAVGAEPDVAVPAAVAVELVHNFSLLHDDVMDGDRTRRWRPAAWTVFGIPAAILAGDALLTLAFGVLARSSQPAAAMRILTSALNRLVDGQTADMALERQSSVSVAECVEMAANKTGALLACACTMGATFGGGSPEQVECLGAFGERLGLAFQHVDDLLGIWGDPAVTGKPVYSDLANRKKSLPVAAALHSGTSAGRDLARLYSLDRQLTGDELASAAKLVEAAGGRRWSRLQAEAHLAAALLWLLAAGFEERSAEEMLAVARLIAQRDH
jgi:geranylgeranyl diphosphate synthase type I